MRRVDRSRPLTSAPHPGAQLLTVASILIGLVACAPQPPPPNVVLIVLDTVRADGVGGKVNGHAVTPHLDRLATTGVRFDSAYATAPWTLPSHATLFTGLAPSQHRAVHEHFVLANHYTTLAEHLKEKGFATYGITSNPWVTKGRGLAQGFAAFEAAYAGAEAASDKGAARASDLAVRFIEAAANTEQPFFLFVNYLEAHLPYAPPDEGLLALGVNSADLLRREYTIGEAEEIITSARAASDDELALARLLYQCEIAYQDQQLGRVFEALEAQQLLDNTLVIVTADHGEHLGAGNMMGHEFSLADDVLQVPLIVRLPGLYDSGAISSKPVSHLDIVPTVLDAVGDEAAPELLDGTSLRALEESDGHDRALIAEYSEPVTLINDYWGSRHPDFDASNFAVSLSSLRRGQVKLIANTRGEAGLFGPSLPATDSDRESIGKEMYAELEAWTKRLKESAPSSDSHP
jgi:arylsulfatase A-like enzyme